MRLDVVLVELQAPERCASASLRRFRRSWNDAISARTSADIGSAPRPRVERGQRASVVALALEAPGHQEFEVGVRPSERRPAAPAAAAAQTNAPDEEATHGDGHAMQRRHVMTVKDFSSRCYSSRRFDRSSPGGPCPSTPNCSKSRLPELQDARQAGQERHRPQVRPVPSRVPDQGRHPGDADRRGHDREGLVPGSLGTR